MPQLSRWMIRAALLYLALGFTLGGLLLANKGVSLSPWLWNVLPAHMAFLLEGWMVQLALGVAFWILPRFASGSRRGNTGLAWVGFGLLNAGLLLVSLAVLAPGLGWLPAAGRAAELLGVLVFAAHAWPRVKPLGA